MTKAERFIGAELVDIIGDVESETEPEAIVKLYSGYVSRFGFDSVGMGQLVNPAHVADVQNDWFRISTWPLEWRKRWMRENFVMHDPIARMAVRSMKSFTWQKAYEHASRFGKEILHCSTDYGFKNGLAIPIHTGDGPPGCVSLGCEKLDLSPRERAAIELLSLHVYMRLETLCGPFEFQPAEELTRREVEVLHYAAAGKTNWEIGMILSISEYSVRDHIKAASRKLNCANRAHVVAIAMQKNLIMP